MNRIHEDEGKLYPQPLAGDLDLMHYYVKKAKDLSIFFHYRQAGLWSPQAHGGSKAPV